MNKKVAFELVISLLMAILLLNTVNAICMEVTVSPTNPNLYRSQSQQITGVINNCNTNCHIICQWFSYQTGSWTNVGDISNDATAQFYFTIQAPSTGSGNKISKGEVYCQNTGFLCGSDSNTKSFSVTLNYGPSPEELQKEKDKATADSAISTARTLISDAQTAISASENKVNEVNRLGSEIGATQLSLNSANTALQNANTYLSSANSAYSSGNYQSAISYGQQAQTSATSGKSNADQVKATATQLIEDWNRKKTEASNKVSDASSSIDTAKLMLQKGEGIVNDATILGLSTAAAKAQIAEAKAKIEAAQNYYKEASSAFGINNFEGAKSKAQLAIQTADESETLASTAYNSLEQQVTIAGEAAKAINEANSEISQMNEILSKMDYVLLSTEKQGIDVSETKNVVTTAKLSVDSAEDLLSQAKNRVAAGSFNDAANAGIEARDKAASSRNRLDTIAQTLSISVQKALDLRLQSSKKLLMQAEAEVNSASGTYGADANALLTAQNKLSEAKNKLSAAESKVQNVKTAPGLTELLQNANEVFKALDESEAAAKLTIDSAGDAKAGLIKKVAIGTAAAVGVAGGGFLFYKLRKKRRIARRDIIEAEEESEPTEKEEEIKKETKVETHKKETKDKAKQKEERKTGKFCGKCSNRLIGHEKFCSKCGTATKR